MRSGAGALGERLIVVGRAEAGGVQKPEGRVDLTARGRGLLLKRAMDIVAAAAALIVLSPLLLAVALTIRLEGPGPVFFVQERWGKGGRRIRIHKFRSMYSDRCDPRGVTQTVPGDPRVTPIGAFLRKNDFDELPQFWNVLRGDMSLVGPRCHAIGMLAGGRPYEELVPDYHERHRMRPGMTGLAQIHGLRGPTEDPARAAERIRLDLAYIGGFSLMLDLDIIWKTILRESGGTGF